ncbi:uncharacterized protein LOC133923854 [Phragmites australis]|uniref:uncharacterized protein LOC133923854 n=1 Tax=Phragmites australis TaxID=29695 RepID=UPI002D7680FB|nr:uncharacterized protein LOC133923854 [Phragmites australis]XP_062225114.1 uncharacterized protein LOC133923854 [Phragmites australis]
MQTRKKGAAQYAAGDHANSKISKPSRRATQFAAAEKKVTDLITSSSKKQKSVDFASKKHSKGGRKLSVAFDTTDTENEAPQVAPSIPHDQQHSDGNADDRPNNSIFSPAYHHHKEGGLNNFSKGLDHKGAPLGSAGSLEEQTTHAHGSKETTLKSGSSHYSECDNLACNTRDGTSCTLNLQATGQNTLLEVDEFSELGNLSSEVSAIYLAMQQSKLECIDEHSQDSTSTEGYVEAEETEEYDEFDPYAFIKDLPDLSMVVPKFRPVLLPKQTRSCPMTTLVLDLDETLVHSTLDHCEDADFTFPVHFNFREHTIYVRCRPYLKEFLERVASMFETIIFTASQSIYAEQLLNVLDPKRKLFRHRVYRESCVYVEGNYLKDLTVLGRDLTRVMIVDNSPQAFGFQLDNGIPIESWFDDPNDKELLELLPFLESLVGVEDVRPYIARKFNLREKVATASSLTMDMQM